MKKNKPFGELFSHSLKKILLTMRIAVILMILGILQARANDAYSQKTRLSLNFSDARLASVLDKIEDESEFFFLYNEKLLDTERKVDIKVNDQLINTVLDDLFTGTDVKYTIVDRKIILAPNYLTEAAPPQQNKITGIVSDKNGPIMGVNVVVTGTIVGTQTDKEGKFSIEVPSGSKSLTFSFIGMQSQEIAIGTSTKINVTMVESAVGLNEVVVTAMGIEKNTKALSYSVQKIEGLKMSAVPQTNFVNALAGRSAGVTVTSSGSGIGGSVKVVMRGNKFISGSNQPLYVVDGVPLLNRVRGGGGNTFGWSADEGDGVSNLNPNDIESISVLKGASGAALYGSQAANGVIVITTKKGKAGFSEINISSSFTTDKPAYIPELQNKYGQTNPGSQFSWGGVTTTAHDNISDFFRTGLTLINSVSFSTGTDKAQTYLSYANTDAKGLFKYNDITKHNFTIRQSERFFNNKLKIDFSVNYMQQKFLNSPSLGLYNVLTYLYEIPRGLDISDYKANPAVWDPVRKLYVQNWWEAPSVQSSYNPYWLIKYNDHDYNSRRTMLKFAAKYDITNSLSFQIRGNMDYTGDNTESKGYAGASSQVETNNGSYSLSNATFTEYYGDAMLNYNKSFGKIQVNAALGSSITDDRGFGFSIGSSKLWIPNVFTLNNIDLWNSAYTYAGQNRTDHTQLQAVFCDLGVTYNDWLSLSMTGRNDWSSNLSYTPNGSYFYPSAGVSAVLHKLLRLPEVISFAKIRGSYAVIGNTVPQYVTNPINSINQQGAVSFNTVTPFKELKPEESKSLEGGAELHFMDDQFYVDFTYYKTNNINQFFTIQVPPGTGYSSRYINAGNIQNSGIELSLGYTLPSKGSFGWSTMINFSTNKNVVKELAKEVQEFYLSQDNTFFSTILKVGGSYNDMYGQVMARDSATGKIIFGADNVPLVAPGTVKYMGNPTPKFQLGWSNTFTYRNFSLDILLDGRFGGKVYSRTQMLLDYWGVSKESADARDAGGVTVDGMYQDGTPVTHVGAYEWYNLTSAKKMNGNWIYDATVIKLREVRLSYSLTVKDSFLKRASFSLIGRNLLYLYKPAPFDSEIAFSNYNSFAGVDAFNLPATRSYGLSLNLTF